MKRRSLFFVLLLSILTFLLSPGVSSSRPQFARMTGYPCSHCHVSPMGGGPLTEDGQAFRAGLDDLDIELDPKLRLSTGQKLLHALLWLAHIPFGVAWIGMFLLAFLPAARTRRPAIPSRQVTRQMIYGMAVVAVSGPTMVWLRIKMTPDLFGTRFGLLLGIKIAAVLCLFTATVVLLWHTTVRLARRYRKLAAETGSGEEMELDREELALFDGSAKRKALVSVDGRLFEVTGRNLWRKGIHPGGHRAGTDLTGAFNNAPHGREVFDRVRPVGRLLEKVRGGKGSFPRWAVFLGTAAAAVIVTVVVLWRW